MRGLHSSEGLKLVKRQRNGTRQLELVRNNHRAPTQSVLRNQQQAPFGCSRMLCTPEFLRK